ncbi:MAG: type IV secretion system DNA-binding domain-containing protein [Patescibacteria group bacterium]|nr:type IV secretion system DNA-binding domain-containing protein [Patescibacteria group bacterium]
MDDNRVTFFAETDARNKRVKFGIKAKDRTKHVYVIGKTGMGKSTLLENMAVQDIQNGEGMCFIDPHGKTADLLLEYVPAERVNDVIYIAPFDVEYPISFNVLESVDTDKRHLVVSGLMSTFKKIWVDAWSARMEYILTNTLLALLEYPGSTLLGVNRMLSDKEFRKDVISKVQDPGVKSFWTKEFANYSERMAQDAVPAIQNKIGQFTANPLIRNMIGQPQSSFDFRQAMDSRKIVIINLSKGRIGDENMKLLGGMLVTKIYLSAMSRADTPERILRTLPNFYLYVDEFQNFANASFADILSEARKYKLNLTIAHQYIEQMDEQVRAAVFGNVGTMIVFRIGATDAEVLEKEFMPTFTVEDLVNLGFTQIYLKLMIDGLTSAPFSAVTLPPIKQPEVSSVQQIVEASRAHYARPRIMVEAEIIKFHESSPKPAPIGGPVQVKNTFVKKQFNPSPAMHTPQSNRNYNANTHTEHNHVRVVELDHREPEHTGDRAPVSSPAPAPKPIPVTLSTLRTTIPKQDTKTATKENVNSLREALKNIINRSQNERTDASTQKQMPSASPKDQGKVRENEQERKQEKPVSETNPAPKEVPADVLRKVLAVDDK